jgi:hypothetical protein
MVYLYNIILIWKLLASPTIASYNASSVKIHNGTSGLLRYENKTMIFCVEKIAVTYHNAGVVVVRSEELGLDPILLRLRFTTPAL